MLKKLLLCPQKILDNTRKIDFLAPCAIRLYLAFAFFTPGLNKLNHIADTAAWFHYSLHLPFPTLMAYLAGLAEVVGAVCLIFGFFTRWMTIPLMFTMLIAIFSVHWSNGWAAIAENNTKAVNLKELLVHVENVYPELHMKFENLKTPIVALNNGIEFGVTYFIMLLSLFFTGAGKYFSFDYWIRRHFEKKGML